MTDLALQGVHKRFGRQVVIPDLDLSVAAGELFVLLGPSGSGKTTILRLIAGLERPDHGRILSGGEDITTLAPQRRRAPMVFQDHLLFPHRTVFDNVAFGLAMRGLDRQTVRERVDRRLADVGLADLANRYPAQLSGGQKQRVALARALVLSPRLLLLDEPFSNLDAGLRQEMRDLLLRLRREDRVTTILVTHDQEEATMLADRIAVLLDGAVAQVGTPEAVWQRPTSRQVATFMGNPNLVRGRVTGGRFTLPGLPGPGLQVPAGRGDGPALAVLRPEALRLQPALSAGGALAAAADGVPAAARGFPAGVADGGSEKGADGVIVTVAESRFAGTLVRYRVDWGGQALEVRVPPGTGPAMPAGTAAHLCWDPVAIWYVDP